MRLAASFIKTCMVTAFPDTRQKMMKSVSAFMIRLRTLNSKNIKRYDPALADDTLWEPLQPLFDFLLEITSYAEENLYLDKPIEGSFPLFDVLKLIMKLFGNNEYKLNKAKHFEPINFLAKAKGGQLLKSKSLFMFLINSMNSSWRNVRNNSFELLSLYSSEYESFKDATFVNTVLIPTALDFLNDPRIRMAEAAALMLKLAFTKCIDVVDLNLLS